MYNLLPANGVKIKITVFSKLVSRALFIIIIIITEPDFNAFRPVASQDGFLYFAHVLLAVSGVQIDWLRSNARRNPLVMCSC